MEQAEPARNRQTLHQRYVSKELTHFVGAKLKPDEDAQYELLRKILNTEPRQLLRLCEVPKGAKLARAMHAFPDKRISDNEMFTPYMVCFCDIPVGDLAIHMKKYSRFGLSFRKDFLASKGASPVFYVAKHSLYAANYSPDAHRGDCFDEKMLLITALQSLLVELAETRGRQLNDSTFPDVLRKLDLPQDLANPQQIGRYYSLLTFLEFEVLGHLKFFDHRLEDHHEQNYYMEREWRTQQDVDFELDDVYRVIIPSTYAKHFRSNFPDYAGQITFADDEETKDRSE